MTPSEEQQLSDDLADDRRRQRSAMAWHRKGLPKSAADVIAQVMNKRGYARIQASEAFDELWQQAVGESLARYTRVGNLRRGVLEVTVASSTVMQELQFNKRNILRKIKQTDPQTRISDLRFRSGAIK